MTEYELDALWQRALHESVRAGEQFTRYRFAALVRAQVIEEAAQRADEHAGAWKNRPVPLLGYTAVLEDCAAAIRGMKSDSVHPATADAGASTAPLPEGDVL